MMSAFEKKVFQCMHETKKSPDEAVWHVLHTQAIAESERIAQRNHWTSCITPKFLLRH